MVLFGIFARVLLCVGCIFAVLFHGGWVSRADARDNIQIVGSSTVFPFAAQVAEYFTRTSSFVAPVVESTGSGGGLKLFCSGLGDQYPDIANSSRKIKASELDLCASNGIDEIVEILIGYDGIVLGSSISAAILEISLPQLFLALAGRVPDDAGELRLNPYRKWSDIAEGLPDYEIKIYGPPPTSGTRDAFLELAMETGAKHYPSLLALSKSDKELFKVVAHSLREDGAFIEAGENDNLIINKLKFDEQAFGIFGYSFLEENSDSVRGVVIDGVAVDFDAIASGSYVLARPLYFYVKRQHVASIPGLREYVAEFVSEKAWGDDGYLSDQGLVPLERDLRLESAERGRSLEILR